MRKVSTSICSLLAVLAAMLTLSHAEAQRFFPSHALPRFMQLLSEIAPIKRAVAECHDLPSLMDRLKTQFGT